MIMTWNHTLHQPNIFHLFLPTSYKRFSPCWILYGNVKVEWIVVLWNTLNELCTIQINSTIPLPHPRALCDAGPTRQQHQPHYHATRNHHHSYNRNTYKSTTTCVTQMLHPFSTHPTLPAAFALPARQLQHKQQHQQNLDANQLDLPSFSLDHLHWLNVILPLSCTTNIRHALFPPVSARKQ